jgi:hypothetical protein
MQAQRIGPAFLHGLCHPNHRFDVGRVAVENNLPADTAHAGCLSVA